ncbi:MAG: anti-sigma factor [Gammaproteobacteria bacterium]|nr:anti-sigma factor [Gammaproteobacteria bacterium]
MNYGDPRLRELLAGEYVLGTLHGAARRRFERLLREDARLRMIVVDWQSYLQPLAEAIPPVAPPERVWQRIQQRITPRKVRPGLWRRLEFWRPAGLMAGALAAALLIYIGLLPPTPVAPGYIAVLSDTAARPVWVVSVAQATGELTIKAVQPEPVAPDKALELWALPKGQPPRSLGLLPASGVKTVALSGPLHQILASATALAVSLEPRGGSPTGQPTGPVLYQGPWLAL